ncbi:MAG: hypothetical protein LBJ08_08895 [Bifidobacteriaceae bacterium]|jgi:hypothetical protein|nr:hypothetical protein [Bifidobacteriaceae bacterium]
MTGISFGGRRRRIALAAALAAGLMTGPAGAAFGLWSASGTVGPATVTSGYVGFAVTGLTPAGQIPSSYEAADGGASELSLAIGPEHAAAVVAASPKGAAWTFDVVAAAAGNVGLNYSIELPQFEPGGILDSAEFTVFPVSDRAECTPTAAPETPVDLGEIQAVPQEYSEFRQSTDHWCVTAVAESLTLGHYINTATVTGVGPDGSAIEPGTDTWEVDVLPDPEEELSDAALIVTHEVLKPS